MRRKMWKGKKHGKKAGSPHRDKEWKMLMTQQLTETHLGMEIFLFSFFFLVFVKFQDKFGGA